MIVKNIDFLIISIFKIFDISHIPNHTHIYVHKAALQLLSLKADSTLSNIQEAKSTKEKLRNRRLP